MNKNLNSSLSLGAIFLGLSLFFTPSAKSASYYWDTLAGAGNGVGSNPSVGSGTNAWSGTGSTWSTTLAGSTALTAGTWTTSGVMGINDTAVFQVDQGTSGSGNFAGTVTVSGTSSFAINVNTTGFTFRNTNTTQNNYLGATNGITLGNGVNLNLSSAVGPLTLTGNPTNGLGLRMSGIQAAAGATGTSITIVGDTGTTAGSGVRMYFDKNYSGNVTNVIAVNTIIATTGSQSAYFNVASGAAVRFEGTVTINNGSKLVLSPGPQTSRLIDVRGNIISSANGALSIGEAPIAGTSPNTGKVFLSGANTLTGDLNVYSGVLGYGNLSAFGTTRLVLNQGTALAQIVAIGDGTEAQRAMNNNILLNGGAWAANTYVTIGGESNSANLAGGVDMNGQGRTIRIDNSTQFSGVISNSGGGGLVLTNNAGSVGGRTLSMAGAATYTGGTTLKSSGTGWKTSIINTTGSAFGDGNVNFDGTGMTVGVRSTLAGTGIMTGTLGGLVQVSAGSASSLGGGLLTVGKLDTATAMSFAFEATSTSLLSAGVYNNDVIRATATAGSPFTQALASGNIIDIYLNAGSLAGYDNGNAGVFQTGFFSASDFSLGSGTFNLFVQATGGATTFNAATYQTWAQYMAATGTALGQSYTISNTRATLANSDTGFISTVTIVPEPSTGALLGFGLGGLVVTRLLRRKQS